MMIYYLIIIFIIDNVLYHEHHQSWYVTTVSFITSVLTIGLKGYSLPIT